MKFSSFILGLMFLSFGAMAQKFAYVDTEYILNQIPEYKQAQEQLANISKEWQAEVEAAQKEVDNMLQAFELERILLTDDLQKERLEAIAAQEEQVRKLQQGYFGGDGELFKKRRELIKPVQDRVFNAINDMADRGGYSMIFDSSKGGSVLFADPKIDKSDLVLRELGY